MEQILPILTTLFNQFNSDNISYFIIRDYDKIASINNCADLDISIYSECRNIALGILENQGWTTPHKNYNHFSHQHFYKWDGVKMYKIDIIWDLYFDDGKYKLKECEKYYSSYQLYQNIRIPKIETGILLLLLHIILDKKTLSVKNKNFLNYLLNKFTSRNDIIIDAERLIISDGKDERVKINFVEQSIKNGIIEKRLALPRLIRKIYIKIVSHLTNRKYKIALIGVDGSGKSSALKKLESYYGINAHTQYFGFRDFQTRWAMKYCSDNCNIKNKYLINILRVISVYIEMWYRYFMAIRTKKRLLFFDRYAWEAADNATVPVLKFINGLLFYKLFPSVDVIVYLHCPVEVSLLRKNDIEDIDSFIVMKKRFDKRYMNLSKCVLIDTSNSSEEEVLKLIVQNVSKITDIYI